MCVCVMCVCAHICRYLPSKNSWTLFHVLGFVHRPYHLELSWVAMEHLPTCQGTIKKSIGIGITRCLVNVKIDQITPP